jgi:hypothetical protein
MKQSGAAFWAAPVLLIFFVSSYRLRFGSLAAAHAGIWLLIEIRTRTVRITMTMELSMDINHLSEIKNLIGSTVK